MAIDMKAALEKAKQVKKVIDTEVVPKESAVKKTVGGKKVSSKK